VNNRGLTSREILRSVGLFWELKGNVRKSPTDLKAIQLSRLRKLLIHAYNHTDHYRKVFEECGFDPRQLKNCDDLQKLPVLQRADVQESGDSFLSNRVGTQYLMEHRTSGSTGIPVRFFSDQRARVYNRALTYRAYSENGVSVTDVFLQITSPEYQQYEPLWFQKLGFLRKYRLSVLEPFGELLAQMNRIKPDVIQCYPSILNLIAQNCAGKSLTFRPKVIFTTAELLLPSWRDNISRYFQCDIRDLYGSSEFHRLAWECEKHEGYHLDTDVHVIEFVDAENKPVERGEGFIVVTGLFNYAFPLIRYKMGDVAKLKEARCSCGRSLPLIESIEGRADDYLTLPSGTRISPRRINLLDAVRGIREYKTTQLRRDLIEVEAVKSEEFTETTIESIKAHILEGCLGETISIVVKMVPSLERTPGKIRTVTSLVE
jgi:phenylacetate-CoA ligase